MYCLFSSDRQKKFLYGTSVNVWNLSWILFLGTKNKHWKSCYIIILLFILLYTEYYLKYRVINMANVKILLIKIFIYFFILNLLWNYSGFWCSLCFLSYFSISKFYNFEHKFLCIFYDNLIDIYIRLLLFDVHLSTPRISNSLIFCSCVVVVCSNLYNQTDKWSS